MLKVRGYSPEKLSSYENQNKYYEEYFILKLIKIGNKNANKIR